MHDVIISLVFTVIVLTICIMLLKYLMEDRCSIQVGYSWIFFVLERYFSMSFTVMYGVLFYFLLNVKGFFIM